MSFALVSLDALALELYFKCLILQESGKYRSGHDLYKLFQALDPVTQKFLSQAHLDYAAKWPSYVATAQLHGYPIELDKLIIRGRHAFSGFRYLHESVHDKRYRNTVFGLRHMPFIVRQRILESNPEWGRWAEHF